MSEDIASRDYEAEIYLLKSEIKRLGEFEDYYIRTHKHVYVAAIVQPYEEKIKRLEAENEALKCCGICCRAEDPKADDRINEWKAKHKCGRKNGKAKQ